ncbi:HAD family hydrolase [Caviibacter abscessus]|uniref:HAD family hydrolase n=1 Tax=Caviibacter abscessus TaxID=1766719 RepID=UPI00082FD912|nr:HAD-IB family hydrolase [Caviibacter abscessus]
MKNIAVFFDIDGTIFRNSLLIEHFKLLIKYEFISTDAWTSSLKEKFEKWANREGDYDEYLLELADIYLSALKNISPDDVDYIAKRVIELKSDKVYKFTKNRIKWHKKMNHKIIIISGSPDFLVEKMAHKLGITDFMATQYIVKNGKYTGEKIPMWDSESKDTAIKKYCEKYNIDLENSYSYGDTSGDFSMLVNVGHPYAINPAKRLLLLIKQNEKLCEKIKIIVERKDVIYDINPNTPIYNEGEN